MNYTFENGVLTLKLVGRVDTSSVDGVTKEIDTIRSSLSGVSSLVLDADELAYISSAGLRLLLRLRKECGALKVLNVNSDVYEVFDMTGFAEILDIEKAYRRLSVDGCPVIGRGAKGTVYRYDEETIVKVYNDPNSLPAIKNERELARKAFVLGVPTAISYDVVRVGDSYGSVFELLSAKSYSQLIKENPDKLDEYVAECASLLRMIHGTEVSPDDMPDIKVTVWKWVKTAEPFLSPEKVDRISALVSAVPDKMTMLHCDYHTNNVLCQNGETLLIDMDTLSHGDPIFELANIYITYVGFGEVNPTIVEDFMSMPYALSKHIWGRSLALYLGTEDEAQIKVVEDKIKLLSYLRLMRHTIRRGGADTDEGRKTIALCQSRIEELLPGIDSLAL